MNFAIKKDFLLDGKPFKIISGCIHYFRVVPEYWEDRLKKLKLMGCNTVETYIPWNAHEPVKGTFDFSGILDIAKFLKTAQDLGLYAIVRPSPYTCGEWEFGGLPGWLLSEPGMKLRCAYKPYLYHVKSYYSELFKVLVPLQITHKGPILMFQIENEYGSYGSDKVYLSYLRDLMTDLGSDIPYVVSDGPWDEMLEAGSVEGVLSTANFGSKGREQLGHLRKFIGSDLPLMCMEFWDGWFDYWGKSHHSTASIEVATEALNEILELGSVNFYMFHGGTNFGFWNGSNYTEQLTPDVTSYDYDAPLSESGDFTPKFYAFQKIISKYAPIPEVDITPIKKVSLGEKTVVSSLCLFDVLGEISAPVRSPYPISMEQLGQSLGYTLYRTKREKAATIGSIQFYGANDRLQVFLNSEKILTVMDKELLLSHDVIKKHGDNAVLDVLVENLGRVNYGHRMERQRKGIDQSIVVNCHAMADYEMFPLSMDNLENLNFVCGSQDAKPGLPGFYKISFSINADEMGDTFLELPGWGKGFVVLNGFNLGRFWEIGPQVRLYVPAPLLKVGENQLIIFESEGKVSSSVIFVDTPKLGNTTTP